MKQRREQVGMAICLGLPEVVSEWRPKGGDGLGHSGASGDSTFQEDKQQEQKL